MACYALESDKLFLSCKDVGVVEVYEIDSLYIAPVRQKHWTLVATIHLGGRQEYSGLQIGDREIRGRELERLMRDLSSLGMMVNCEGLCFLKTESTIGICEKYYRMFDLFDWSIYHVNSVLATRWIRNDIVSGRPMVKSCMQSLSEQVEELVELKFKNHGNEAEELKGKKCTHTDDIDALACKHLADLEEFERRKEEELKVKQGEIDKRDAQIKNIEDELKLYCYKKSDSDNIEEYFSQLVRHFQRRAKCFLSSRVRVLNLLYTPPVDQVIIVPVGEGGTRPFSKLNVNDAFAFWLLGRDHWTCIEIEVIFTVKRSDIHNFERSTTKHLIYYDGSGTYPCSRDYPSELRSPPPEFRVFYILGAGFKLGFIYISSHD